MRYQQLVESISFMPGIKQQDHISWPKHATKKVQEPCEFCDGTGIVPADQTGLDNHRCPHCNGQGYHTNTEYLFPDFTVSNRNAAVVCEIMGKEPDYTGWVDAQELPSIRRRLVRIINGDTTAFEIAPSTSGGEVQVDQTGEIPRITRGATIYDLGVSHAQIINYAHYLLQVIQWAQENHCGIYWA
jgi:hypothetical protein